MNEKLTPSGIVILVAGGFMLVSSFMAFWKLDLGPGLSVGGIDVGDPSFNAWSTDFFFPVTILPVLCGVLMAAHVGLTSFATISLPSRVLGFTWNQLHLILGLQAAIMMLAFLLQENGPFQLGIGFYLMLISALGLAIGALMREREAPIAS